MKQLDIKAEREINGCNFLVRPFPAFKAANISGDLATLIMPVLTSMTPALGNDSGSILDMDAAEAAPLLAKGLGGISGDRVEALLRKLLTKYGNIAVTLEGESTAKKLTDDLADEVFCGNAQDMFVLAFEVIKVNFSGFFEKVGSQFGEVLSGIMKKTPQSSESTENLTRANSPS